MSFLRVHLYRTRERRAAAACILSMLACVAFAAGAVLFALLRAPWSAVTCGALVPVMWATRGWALERAVYWAERKHAEILYLDREGFSAPPEPVRRAIHQCLKQR